MHAQQLILASLARASKQIERVNAAFSVDQYWLEAAQGREAPHARLQLNATIDVGSRAVRAVISAETPPQSIALEALADLSASPLLTLNAPLRLQPVIVQKPWGREIWFTGIEARGHSRVVNGAHSLPLAHLLALAPEYLCQNRDRSLVLLKVLDPHPDPALGDLYFELHEEKREVYVVTHVDERAWPDGRGAIRFGVNQKLRRSSGSEQRFRSGFLDAVRKYEQVRRAIDALLDARRARESTPLDEPVPPDVTQQWLADVPKALRDEEELSRAAMHRFTQLRRLDVGDVVAVPILTPHALQHGVRVVEFQTPTYERRIVSFTQKVLSQDHWDSDVAIAQMHLDAPRTQIEVLSNSPDVRVERIVSFPDFQVQRIRLARGASLPIIDAPYAICLGIDGTTHVGNLALTSEQGCFVPNAALQRGADQLMLHNGDEEDAVCLLALPK